MRRWSRLAAVCIAAGTTLALAGCGQLFQVRSASQPSLAELTQRVDQLEAQVSELNAAVAGMGQGRGQAATSSAAAGQAGGAPGEAAGAAAQAIVTASYLNVHPQPDVSTPRVGVLKHDTIVSVLASQGSWTKIGFHSLQGWVESQWLRKPGQGPAAPAGDSPAGSSGAASGASSSGAAAATSGSSGAGSTAGS
jgi:pilus assembly protein FimV